MKQIEDPKELAKIIRTRLISQSGVDANHVLNGQSLYGAMLQKNPEVEGQKDDTQLTSLKETDSSIVFNINNSLSTDDVVEEQADGTFVVYASFTSTCMFYGKNCALNAITVKARFLTQELLEDFKKEGVHIQEIESKDQINEFINGRLITRQDIIIHFSCEIKVTKLVNYDQVTSINISPDWLTVK